MNFEIAEELKEENIPVNKYKKERNEVVVKVTQHVIL